MQSFVGLLQTRVHDASVRTQVPWAALQSVAVRCMFCRLFHVCGKVAVAFGVRPLLTFSINVGHGFLFSVTHFLLENRRTHTV